MGLMSRLDMDIAEDPSSVLQTIQDTLSPNNQTEQEGALLKHD